MLSVPFGPLGTTKSAIVPQGLQSDARNTRQVSQQITTLRVYDSYDIIYLKLCQTTLCNILSYRVTLCCIA